MNILHLDYEPVLFSAVIASMYPISSSLHAEHALQSTTPPSLQVHNSKRGNTSLYATFPKAPYKLNHFKFQHYLSLTLIVFHIYNNTVVYHLFLYRCRIHRMIACLLSIHLLFLLFSLNLELMSLDC